MAEAAAAAPAAGAREGRPRAEVGGEGGDVATAADTTGDGLGGGRRGQRGEVPRLEEAAEAVPVRGSAPLQVLLQNPKAGRADGLKVGYYSTS